MLKLSRLIYIQICTKMPFGGSALLITIFAITGTINGVNAVPPRNPVCPEYNRIAWRQQKPYFGLRVKENIENNVNDGTNMTGIVLTIFNKAMNSCCQGNIQNKWLLQFSSQDEAVDIFANDSIDFIMPIQRDLKSQKFLHNPFVSVVESPGIAFYVVSNPSTHEAIVEAITSTWPMIAIMFMLVTIAGTFFWLLEMITLTLQGEECKSFRAGVWEGIWWAFVSMTTVGYGDICPRTKPGKLFSMIWVITGVACCALFTSYITTILTSICLMQGITLGGTEIGVLMGSEEHKFAIKKNAIPKPYTAIDEIVTALRNNDVKGALIESFVAAEYQTQLSGFRLQTIIEHVSSYGIVFQNKGTRFSKCIREYVFSRQGAIFDIISNSTTPIKMERTSSAEENSKRLIDSRSASFFIPLSAIIIMLTLFFVTGVVWECKRAKAYRLKQAACGEDLHDLTLTKWRVKYQSEMHKVLMDIDSDVEVLKEKCLKLQTKFQQHSSGLVSAKIHY